MAYPDLQTMFNNGMGSFASLQLGQQQAEEQKLAALKQQQQQAILQEQVLKNQQQQAMNPLDQMFRQGQVQQQQAQLPGLAAESQLAQTKASAAQQTAASQIAAEISKNKSSMTADKAKEMAADAQKMIQAGAVLSQVPEMQRPAAFMQMAKQYGIEDDNPFIKSFQQIPPAKLPEALRSMGEGMAMSSQEYITGMAREREQSRSRKETAQIGAGAQIESAKIAANSRLQVAQEAGKIRQSVANSKMSTDQKLAALTSIPREEMTEDDVRQINELREQRIRERQAGANTLPNQMLNVPTPMQTPVPQFGSGATQQAQPTVPAPTGQLRQIGTSGGRPVFEDAQGNRFIK